MDRWAVLGSRRERRHLNDGLPVPAATPCVTFPCRLDWHLLSTMTPSINAWLKPSDRLLVSLRRAQQVEQQRHCAVLAWLMAEAMDAQGSHLPPRVRVPIVMGQSHLAGRTGSWCRSCPALTWLTCSAALRR